MKYIKGIFGVLTLFFFGYMIVGQIVLQEDVPGRFGICNEYNQEIYAVYSDGAKELFEKADKTKGIVALETTLPLIEEGVNSICFGGRNMVAYIDGQKVYETAVQNNGWFSSANPEHYMMIPISTQDSGKVLHMDIDDNNYIMYQSYIGNEFGIWSFILKRYSGELIVAAITMIMGCLTIIISKVYGLVIGKKIEITYLGVGVFFSAIWLVVNSIYRQVMFPNLSIASDFPFLMVMLIPYPFLIYMNIVQNRRFERIYVAMSCILTFVNVHNCALYILGKKELIETFIYVALACIVSIISIVISFIIDLRSGRIKEYKFVAFGLLGAFASAVIQLVTYFFRTGIFSGTYLSIGLLILLVCASIHTVHNVFQIEKDKTAAVMASDAKGRFLSSMSHEIRTPINAVLGMDEMILRESKEDNIRDYALDIQNAGKSLLALINDILDISKIESGKMEILPVEYDMSSMLNDTMNMIFHKAKAKDLFAKINVDENIPSRLIGDDLRIRQILVNILNNAVKYTEEGGVILELKGDYVDDNHIILHFKIEDTGIGIKEEDLPKLYAQFERIEEDRNRNIEGTGLGMSITLNLLEMMDSKLQVTSEYGKGSCFYFDLKQDIVDRTPIGDLSKRISEQKKDYSYRNNFCAKDAKLLVVDDNAVNRKVVRSLLKDIGATIDEADSGEKCLEMVTQKTYDIIFLDHMMPGLDGIETLQALKNLERNRNLATPVIALTANAVTGAKEMYLDAGFDDFLTKPVIYSKLENMLLKYLSKDKIIEVVETDEVVIGDEAQEIDDLLANIPEMNLEYALMLNGNKNVLVDTLVDFATVIDSELKELNRYKELLPDEEAFKQYRVKVHSIKASAMLVGQVYLSGMARMLELAAIDRKIGIIEATHETFVEELLKKKQQLEVFATNSEQSSDLMDYDSKMLIEQLELLIQAVIEVDIDKTDAIVEYLKCFDYPTQIKDRMQEVYSAAMNLDENSIISVLDAIK